MPTNEKSEIKHLSLFSGIGGFDLAAEWMGWENIAQVEIDKFCLKILEKNFPYAKRYTDIRTFPASDYAGRIDIITGGFPCQPFSQAGQRRGANDDRHLWPEMLRIIRTIKPSWIVAENVRGLLTIEQGMVFEQICVDLENEGYEIQSFVIPALAVNAPHRRDRIWFIANSNSKDVERRKQEPKSNGSTFRAMVIPELWKSRKSLLPKTVLCRTDDGIPNRVDRTRALGNAIVPEVAYQIFKSLILSHERRN